MLQERYSSYTPEIKKVTRSFSGQFWVRSLLIGFLLGVVLSLFLTLPAHASEIRGQTVFLQINRARELQKLRPLKPNTTLIRAAQKKAEDMANFHYFAHRSPRGETLENFAKGYVYLSLGENLARGYFSTEDLVASWLKSPTHRANILDPSYRETGIGIAQDSDGKIYVAQYFGN